MITGGGTAICHIVQVNFTLIFCVHVNKHRSVADYEATPTKLIKLVTKLQRNGINMALTKCFTDVAQTVGYRVAAVPQENLYIAIVYIGCH